MENKTRSLRIVLLLTLAAFGGLVFLSTGQRAPQKAEAVSYGLDAELKWVATGENADFALVQDTLSYYANAFGMEGPALSSNFRLDHCCDDPVLRSAWTDQADFYHLRFSADFVNAAARQQLLDRLIGLGYLRLGKFANQYGMAHGNADLVLPVPHQPGRMLEIRGSQFDLSFVPRLTEATESDPLA
ncbi:MAG TPA: hypothetical protein VHS96_11320 [Bacteroidia bacterium]|nr:hypothetical protein [Bacteroidia bacterium]